MSIFNQRMTADELNEAELRGYLLAMAHLKEMVDIFEADGVITEEGRALRYEGLERLKLKYCSEYLKRGGPRLKDQSLSPGNLERYRDPGIPESVPDNMILEFSHALWKRLLPAKP